jgi:predicted RNA-binding protein YlqC (UPF0109 family)
MPMIDTPDPRDVLVQHLLFRLISVLVDHPSETAIRLVSGEEGATFLINAHPDDVGKIIGAQGRTAKSLRTIVSGIGRKMGRKFTVVIEESDRGQARSKLDAREILPV